MQPHDTQKRIYAVEIDGALRLVRASNQKQAIAHLGRMEDARIRALATARIATFEDGQEAERNGIRVIDIETSTDPSQLDIEGV